MPKAGKPETFRLRQIVPTEKQEHMAFMSWCRTQPVIRDIIIHIPNGEKRDKITGYHLKQMGVRPGVSDFFLPLPVQDDDGNWFHGLWLELKRKSHANESSEQRNWINSMRFYGYQAFFCYGCDDAIQKLKNYVSGIVQ